MIRLKRFSSNLILNYRNAPGFIKGRKYDTDMDRLQRGSYKRELSQGAGNLGQEMKKLKNDLKNGNL